MNIFLKELNKDLMTSAVLLTKSALAVPEDKHFWSPGGKARSTYDMLVECACFPQWMKHAIDHRQMPSEHESNAWKDTVIRDAKTVSALCEVITQETKKYCEYVATFNESTLTEEMSFPWGTYTIAGALGFHYWNNTYHLGQINYIQLILGDTEMHI